jgi:hypothetical protein
MMGYERHMKAKPSSVSSAKQKKGSTTGVTAILRTPKEPVTEVIHTTEKPGARGTHGSPGRDEIRKTTHRVMGSRQSQRPLERSGQPRQKRG